MATIAVHAPTDFSITRNDGSNGGSGANTWNSNLIDAGKNYNSFENEQIDLRFVYHDAATTDVSFDDSDGFLKDISQSVSGDSVQDDRLNTAVTLNGKTYTPTPEGTHMSQGAVHVQSEYVLLLEDADGKQYTVSVISISTGFTVDVVGFTFIGDTPADGAVLYYRYGTGSYLNDEDAKVAVPCFVSGTQILTDKGLVVIEDLSVGDMVMTMDDGAAPIRWIGSRHLTAAELDAQPKLRPIRIRAGAFAPGVPATDLLVSPQHRILVQSTVARRMFDADQVLIAAKQLLGYPGVEIAEDLAEVTYWHILFEGHQLVFSNGMPTESLFTGAEALKSVGPAAREEIFALFPELTEQELVARAPVRLIVKGAQGRKLVERILRNNKRLAA